MYYQMNKMLEKNQFMRYSQDTYREKFGKSECSEIKFFF